jgi:hypothetical protein
MEKDLPKLVSGKEFYEKHKNTNCYINSKKYFYTLTAINAFLSKLKKINKKPLDEAFKRDFRALLQAKPLLTDHTKKWKDWKNKVLEHLTSVVNIPSDLCQSKVSQVEPIVKPIVKPIVEKQVEKTVRCSTNVDLPFELQNPPPFELDYSTPIVSDDSSDKNIVELGFSQDIYMWKHIISPITEHLDKQVSDLLDTITHNESITPYLVKCKNVKTYPTSSKEETYAYFLTGGSAYRGIAAYLHQLLPSLPVLETIAPKSHDYDINFISKDISSLSTEELFSIIISFCNELHTKYHSVWNKVYHITGCEVQFIKPSPCIDREGLIYSDYQYVHEYFLVTANKYAYKIKSDPSSLSFQITMAIQIKTPTETYCSTDHILDLIFSKEESEPLKEKYEIHANTWFPRLDIQSALIAIANQKRIQCIPSTQVEGIQRFVVGSTTYQVPNINVLCLLSVDAIVNRGSMEEIRFYKARQDYARMYAVLRMLQTVSDKIISNDEIAYLYTLLRSITVRKNWDSLSDEKKQALIQMYKDALHDKEKQDHLSWKAVRTATIYDPKTKKHMLLKLGSYYTSPYEEIRTHPKEEDPLLWELGVAKFNLRRHIIDTATKEKLTTTKLKSCDGTALVKRKTVKRTSPTVRKTRKNV